MATSRSDRPERRDRGARPGPLSGRRVLVANRGEIACRILRAVRDEGGLGIAVYSDADRRRAPRAARRRGAPARPRPRRPRATSTSSGSWRWPAARGPRCVHPGYGFLSENADFARGGRGGGLDLDRSPARRDPRDGRQGRGAAARSPRAACRSCREPARCPADPAAAPRRPSSIGYPVLIKAAFGGGGKGMRLCANREELARGDRARAARGGAGLRQRRRSTSRSDPAPAPHRDPDPGRSARQRSIHLGERECSIQRRHQKLIEECPSPAAVPGPAGADGRGGGRDLPAGSATSTPGTVEFLLDPDGDFYFLEMNTRLQVEHPVTEMVTRLDIVHGSCASPRESRSTSTQEQVRLHGHAIECRINAEDPEQGFLPSAGRIVALPPAAGTGRAQRRRSPDAGARSRPTTTRCSAS